MRSLSLLRRLPIIASLLLLFSSSSGAATPSQNGVSGCRDNLGSPIKDFCVVAPKTLWRGSRPDASGAAWLIQNGVQTIVNLQFFHDDKATFRQAKIAGTGISEVGYFRVRDKEPLVFIPAIADNRVAHFLAITSAQPKPLYVHCAAGKNRTGVMVAAYRVMVENVPVEQAIDEMERYHGRWFKADAKYIRYLASEGREDMRRNIEEVKATLKEDAQIECAQGVCTVSER